MQYSSHSYFTILLGVYTSGWWTTLAHACRGVRGILFRTTAANKYFSSVLKIKPLVHHRRVHFSITIFCFFAPLVFIIRRNGCRFHSRASAPWIMTTDYMHAEWGEREHGSLAYWSWGHNIIKYEMSSNSSFGAGAANEMTAWRCAKLRIPGDSQIDAPAVTLAAV